MKSNSTVNTRKTSKKKNSKSLNVQVLWNNLITKIDRLTQLTRAWEWPNQMTEKIQYPPNNEQIWDNNSHCTKTSCDTTDTEKEQNNTNRTPTK